jgi:hypothetical protein
MRPKKRKADSSGKGSPRNDNLFRCAQKTPRASDKQRRRALGYHLGSSARSRADKANFAMRPQDPPLKTTLH